MVWVIETILTDDPSVCEPDWDTWNIGLVEGGRFRVVYSCFSEADAVRLKTALEWFEEFERGSLSLPGAPAPPPRVKRTHK